MFSFTFVLLFILRQHCKYKSQTVGPLMIFIAILSLLNSIFGIIKIVDLFPLSDFYHKISVVHMLEDICFYGATWLFGVKYYESALDVQMIVKSISEAHKSVPGG